MITAMLLQISIGMGWPMKDGTAPEEVRAPGYDDWNLNGDILVMHPLTGYRHELSSMGIRVDANLIVAQLKHRGVQITNSFNQAVIEEKLPYSYGGGIGISRLLMLLLRTAHIGEFQCGLWHDEHYRQVCGEPGVDLIPDRIVDFLNPHMAFVEDGDKKKHGKAKAPAKTEGIWDIGSFKLGQ